MALFDPLQEYIVQYNSRYTDRACWAWTPCASSDYVEQLPMDDGLGFLVQPQESTVAKHSSFDYRLLKFGSCVLGAGMQKVEHIQQQQAPVPAGGRFRHAGQGQCLGRLHHLLQDVHVRGNMFSFHQHTHTHIPERLVIYCMVTYLPAVQH